mmetsp:Transcript_35166/g.88619  ORF Transcript_35166/g.88619 Transcript_35166/m.88619 type:complete len:226 (-) Transcript_35166:137-814(-)
MIVILCAVGPKELLVRRRCDAIAGRELGFGREVVLAENHLGDRRRTPYRHDRGRRWRRSQLEEAEGRVRAAAAGRGALRDRRGDRGGLLAGGRCAHCVKVRKVRLKLCAPDRLEVSLPGVGLERQEGSARVRAGRRPLLKAWSQPSAHRRQQLVSVLFRWCRGAGHGRCRGPTSWGRGVPRRLVEERRGLLPDLGHHRSHGRGAAISSIGRTPAPHRQWMQPRTH